MFSNKQSLLARLLSFGPFTLVASWRALRSDCDVMVCSSGPLFIGIPGLVAKAVRGIPFVLEIRDVLPECAAQIGAVRGKASLAAARWLERLYYARADRIVALSPGMAEWIMKESGREDVEVIPNASDNEAFEAIAAGGPSRGSTGRPVAVYAGCLGQANNPWQLREMSRRLKDRGSDVMLHVYGDGREFEGLRAWARESVVDNVVFFGNCPKVDVFEALSQADCGFILFPSAPIMDTASPNKLFDYLAAGAPVAQATQGWVKQLLEEQNCGLTAPRNDPAALADAIIEIVSDPSRARVMSENARAVARSQFDRGRLSEQFLDVLRQEKRKDA